MDNLKVLNKLELNEIQGGGPISDWVAVKVRSFIDSFQSAALSYELPPADFDAAWERQRRGSML